MCIFVAITEKLSIRVESLHFPKFSVKCCKCKIKKRDGHGKLRNGHGKVMTKYFVNSVGTLVWVSIISLGFNHMFMLNIIITINIVLNL